MKVQESIMRSAVNKLNIPTTCLLIQIKSYEGKNKGKNFNIFLEMSLFLLYLGQKNKTRNISLKGFVAGVVGLEPPTNGFGDHYSTNSAIPLQHKFDYII